MGKMDKKEKCNFCGGSGKVRIHYGKTVDCKACDPVGSGETTHRRNEYGRMVERKQKGLSYDFTGLTKDD